MKLEDAFASLCPGVPLYAVTPTTLPAAPFAVLSQQTDASERDLFRNERGHAPQIRRVGVLLNVWAAEGATPERLRPTVRPLREELADIVTAYADLPSLSGVRRGAHNLEAATPTLRRPMFWMRLELTYLE